MFFKAPLFFVPAFSRFRFFCVEDARPLPPLPKEEKESEGVNQIHSNGDVLSLLSKAEEEEEEEEEELQHLLLQQHHPHHQHQLEHDHQHQNHHHRRESELKEEDQGQQDRHEQQHQHQHQHQQQQGLRKVLFTGGIVAAWYFSNISVLLLNKYLLSSYGFRYPIFLTMCHMAACAALSYVAVLGMKIVPVQTIRSRVQFMKICALSLVFCGSVVGGNISLRYLPISFNQAVGATAPLFTALFAYIATSKREPWLAYAALIPVVTGLIIASGGEPSFHNYGFIICACATAGRALKSVLQGILLSSEGEKLNSMNLLLYMAPIAVLVLLPITLSVEPNVVGTLVALTRKDPRIILYLAVNSTMAYFVNLSNFLVTKYTSPLTLQVLGNAKGAVAVTVSILVFRNPVSVTGMLGYALSVCGVILYGKAKQQPKLKQ